MLVLCFRSSRSLHVSCSCDDRAMHEPSMDHALCARRAHARHRSDSERECSWARAARRGGGAHDARAARDGGSAPRWGRPDAALMRPHPLHPGGAPPQRPALAGASAPAMVAALAASLAPPPVARCIRSRLWLAHIPRSLAHACVSPLGPYLLPLPTLAFCPIVPPRLSSALLPAPVKLAEDDLQSCLSDDETVMTRSVLHDSHWHVGGSW